MKELFAGYFESFSNVINYRIFTFGGAEITPLNIVFLVILTVLLFWLSNKFKNFFVERLLGKTQLELGARVAIGTIVRYIILLLGSLIIIQSVGINLTTLNVLAGAIGIGVGFGLQNIAGNFISGLIILFERPIQVGDRIEVGEVDGKVMSIGARSTTVRTNDNITFIVPNSKFIEEAVVNWSFRDQSVRFRVPVGVAYDSDLNLVKRLLLEVSEENPDVLKEPKAAVRLIKIRRQFD
ncbi:MAG: mechanosensitive ion channel [Blastocatellia bacterium]|nr:mechanosensitive ion channel [Blastocatellia bacterium]